MARHATKVKFTIGGVDFRTKKALEDWVRALVGRYPIGTTLDDADFEFVRELVDQHPDRDQKVGVGVLRIEVVLSEWKNKCFLLHRSDGTTTDCSWVTCVNGGSVASDVRSALRWAVRAQVLAFKEGRLDEGAVCPFRGIALTSDNSAVDHVKPDTFAALVGRFLRVEGRARAGPDHSADRQPAARRDHGRGVSAPLD